MADEVALRLSCAAVINRTTQLLSSAGFSVVPSFDLRTARSLLPDCTCPHHGTTACDCDYSVLLVYSGNHPPLTLVVHGHDGYSWLLWVDGPDEVVDQQFLETVKQTLSVEHFLTSEGA